MQWHNLQKWTRPGSILMHSMGLVIAGSATTTPTLVAYRPGTYFQLVVVIGHTGSSKTSKDRGVFQFECDTGTTFIATEHIPRSIRSTMHENEQLVGLTDGRGSFARSNILVYMAPCLFVFVLIGMACPVYYIVRSAYHH